jgi:hypothetical protein
LPALPRCTGKVELLEPLVEKVPGPGSVRKAEDWPQASKDLQVAALEQARALEAQALPKWQELAKQK